MRACAVVNGDMLSRVALAFPPALSPGDLVAVVAPSSPFPRDELLRGLAWLRSRYRIRIMAGAFAREGYLAGSDARRATELEAAMADDEIRAIVAARGGYGAMRVLERVTWDGFAKRPKWIVGFSDVTVLHAMAWASGVASVHAPNATGLGRDCTAGERAAWLSCLERPRDPRLWSGLRVLRPGKARGPIVGGNLALLQALAAAGRLRVPDGAVLALEDVTEAPYRVDRMLTSLRLGGHLARAQAIVLGGFDRCAPGSDGRTVEEVLDDRLGDLGVPVVAGAPFGHGARNEAFVLGKDVELEGSTLRL
ncbi:MAG TPA: LD-carboxypeptidase [Polyangiaceae bacterium]